MNPTILKEVNKSSTDKKRYGSALSLEALLFLLFSIPLFSQPLTLSRQVVPVEVSKSSVHAILEDSYGFIWFGGSGLHRHDGQSFKAYNDIANDSLQEGLGTVYALLEDSRGRIWIGTSNGLFRYDRESDQLAQHRKERFRDKVGDVSAILSFYEDNKSRLWIGGEDNIFILNVGDGETIKRINIQAGTSYQRRSGVRCIRKGVGGKVYAATTNGLWEISDDFSMTQNIPESAKNDSGLFMIFDAEMGKNDSLWLATSFGLCFFETTSHQFHFVEIPGYKSKIVRELLWEENGTLWIANKSEIWKRQPDGAMQRMPGIPTYLSDGVNVFAKDRFGNLWVGGNDGLGRMNFPLSDNLPVYKIESQLPNPDNFFFRVMQDSTGGFWFRMLRSGLGYCPRLDGEFQILLQPSLEISNEEIKNFCTDKDGNVWVITLTKGLFLFPKGQKKGQLIDLGVSMYVASTASILADHQNNRLLWFSSKFGLCSIDRVTLQKKWYHPINDLPWLDRDNVGQFEQAADGNIWCAMMSKGRIVIGYFDKESGKFFAEPELPGRPDALRAYQLKRVPDNKIWVATDVGLIIIDTKQKKQTYLSQANGLPTKSVLAITPDRLGNVWYTVGRKLCKFDGAAFHCYNTHDEMGGFAHTSSTLTNDGMVVFGGSNGLLVFDPGKPQKDTIRPKVMLTGFRVFNKERKLGKAYELVKEISLPFEENVFTLEFSGLHFIQPQSIKYKHKLEGFDRDWVETGSDERKITYTNLSPDTYTFKVLAANVDGCWSNEAEGLIITLHVLPPWYRTWYAYLLYALAIGSILYGIRNYELKRQLAKAETRRLQELNAVKTRLYTNITHEFRTPLTIILGEASQLEKQADGHLKNGLAAIRRNGRQLLNLVNQMLDLAKLESGSLKLNMAQGDVVVFLKYLLESFQSLAVSKGVALHFSSAMDSFSMDYDAERLRQIVANLLSNAVKFTPSGGEVTLAVRLDPSSATGPGFDSTIALTVSDTGPGIPPEKLPFIFDRFYQADDSATRHAEGTGIGLTLTKELVKLFNGEISVESQAGKGTEFIVRLPVSRKAALSPTAPLAGIEENRPNQPSPSADNPMLGDTSLPSLLIIEDNPDVVQYVSAVLQKNYRLLTAPNGRLGLEMAQREIPDIILSDVMMPEMDGYEVCRALKTDLRTSHIPVVLLTAKADFDSRMEGLEGGAEAYLAKPFEERELQLVLRKLLENRELLRRHFTSGEFVGGAERPVGAQSTNQSEVKANPRDEQFLKEVLEMVNAHLDDYNLSAEGLADLLHLAYSNLYKKVKALTGMGVTEYIRHVRLHRAGQLLLEKPEWTITHIALEVGFNNLNFFSREFKKMMGKTPREYRKGPG